MKRPLKIYSSIINTFCSSSKIKHMPVRQKRKFQNLTDGKMTFGFSYLFIVNTLMLILLLFSMFLIEGIRYPCDQCEHAATRMSDLKRHIRRKHTNIKESVSPGPLYSANLIPDHHKLSTLGNF